MLCSCHIWGCKKGSRRPLLSEDSGNPRQLPPILAVSGLVSTGDGWAASTRVRISRDLRDVPLDSRARLSEDSRPLGPIPLEDTWVSQAPQS